MTDNLETVATFHDLTQAQGARAALEAEGISTELQDETTGSIDWGLMPALGGLRLQVRQEDVARALEIIEQLPGEEMPGGSTSAAPPEDEEEAGFRDTSRRHKRLVGLVALLLLLVPAIVGLILLCIAWLAG